MNPIIIEVKGIGFPNKGAELMLVAIIEEFSRRGVKVFFAVEPNSDYLTRAKYGLFQIARLRVKRVNLGSAIGLLPAKLKRTFGIVSESEIDVVFDASGFAYGDVWGKAKALHRLGSSIRRLRKSGKKVVLLPQAFGPFEQMKDVMAHILNDADLVYPRDAKSAEYCQEISDKAEIRQCPDFTNIVEGIPWIGFDANLHQVCIIPNSKMLEMTASGVAYIKMLQELIKTARSSNHTPYILIHEGIEDKKLARDIVAGLDFKVDVLQPDNPLMIKWVIGQSYLVISSRFHGLVSALSQNVPVIATGWSHKYQALLEDYNVGGHLYDVDSQSQQAKAELLRLLEDRNHRNKVVEEIKINSVELKKRVNEMWDSVFSLIC